MWNSKRPNTNSLFALEQSLFGDSPSDEPSEQFSVEEPEEQEVEARAFDWDEAIELDYQDNTESDAMSMSWDDTEDTSHGFDLEDEDTPTYDVKSFAVEEEELPEGTDPLSHSNSLFALEQSVFGITPTNQPVQQFSVEEDDDEALSHSNSLFALEQSLFGTTSTNQPAEQFSIEEAQSQGVKAQAFDWDEAIELEYSEDTYPTAMSLDWLPTDDGSESFGLGEEPLTFEVEAFEVDDEAVPEPKPEAYPSSGAFEWNDGNPAPVADEDSAAFEVNTNNATPQPTPEEEKDSAAFEFNNYNPIPKPTSQAYSAPKTVTVDATVVPPSPAPKSVQPAIDFDELERAPVTSRASDTEAFAADLEAILRGEKTYEPPAETPTPTAAPQFPPAPQSHAQSVAPKPASAHDIFDQMGRNMAHATAFDLGTFSLEQRFDEFDRLLDGEESEHLHTKALNDEKAPVEIVAQEEKHPQEINQIGRSLSQDTPGELGTVSWEQRFDDFDRLLDQDEQKSLPKSAAPSQSIAPTPSDAQPLSNPLELDEMELGQDLATMSRSVPQDYAGQLGWPTNFPLSLKLIISYVIEALRNHKKIDNKSFNQLVKILHWIVENQKECNHKGYFHQIMEFITKNLEGEIGLVYQAKDRWLAVNKKVFPSSSRPKKDPKNILVNQGVIIFTNPGGKLKYKPNKQAKESFDLVDSENLSNYQGEDGVIFFEYPDLFTLIKDGKTKCDDSELANAIRRLVNNGSSPENEYVKLIYLVMFGAETIRCPRWFGMSMMVLDLISTNKITWNKVFGRRTNGEPHYWPPSQNNAVYNSAIVAKENSQLDLPSIQEENAIIEMWIKEKWNKHQETLAQKENETPQDWKDRLSNWLFDQFVERFSKFDRML